MWRMACSALSLIAASSRLISSGRRPLVDRHPLVGIRNEAFGDPEIDLEVQSGTRDFSLFVTRELSYRLFQQLAIQIESYRVDMPVLFSPEEIAGSPQLQIQRRDPESRPQVTEHTDGGQPAPGDR